MSTHRAGTTSRLLVLLALTVVAVLGAGSTAANATFSDAAGMSATTVGTGTVTAATKVRIDTSCITTTTVIKLTYRTTATGTYQIGYAEASGTATSTSNIEGDDTVTTPSSTTPAEYPTPDDQGHRAARHGALGPQHLGPSDRLPHDGAHDLRPRPDR